MKSYTFIEPHHTGGHCTVEITEEQIVKHMRKYMAKVHPEIKDASDQQLIDEFVIVNWAVEKGVT